MKNIGLVLEGGGLRGSYTAGVLDAFLELGISFPYCVGVSAGACNAVSYISEQKGRNFDITKNYCNDKRYMSFKNLLTTGNYFGTDMLFNKIPNELIPFDYNAFENSACKLIAGVTNCKTGKTEYFNVKNLKNNYHILRASSSLPYMATMVDINGELYLDGGVCAPIPYLKSIEDGNEKNVIILTQPKGFVKKPSRFSSAGFLCYPRFPNLVRAMKNRHSIYNNSLKAIEELEENGNAFVLRPSRLIDVSRTERDLKKLKEIYDLGFSDAMSRKEELINFINKGE